MLLFLSNMIAFKTWLKLKTKFESLKNGLNLNTQNI